MKFRYLLFVLSCVGCTMSGVTNSKYSYNSAELNDTNSGIVLGKIVGDSSSGTGITLLNQANQEEIDYHGANVFCLRLPSGKYAFDSMGDRYLPLASNNPLQFEVQPGERKYIGTVVKPWLHPKFYKIDKNKISTIRNYWWDLGITGHRLKDYDDPIPIVVVNDMNDIQTGYEKDCPALSVRDVVSAPMY